MTRRGLLGAGALAVLGVACGSDSEPAADLGTTTTTAEEVTTSTVDPNLFEEEVDIGDGKTMYLRCAGTGSPTVLLEAGDESGHEDWSKVDGDLEQVTRTCEYDRLGTGRSCDPGGAPAPVRRADQRRTA